MFKFLKKLFGEGTDYSQLVKNGAVIVDVRTKQEFASGHIKGSKNIPLDSLSGNLNKLKNRNQSIITCCASGMRSASAKQILKSRGYQNVYNGGGWTSLKNKIQ
ncbi:sulfurtransferase [Christiangramia fulva]|uniref:Sulfurtransferase n=1 Tax=Christiangramia fulva TaxID=2126553 RepID=A0A2R3Z166_9FLAO|nr:rhodanese-like domain-containing protein [Christiangramia fulva]AVR43994.1 sulfurtransferase [Christiangramia fulva]